MHCSLLFGNTATSFHRGDRDEGPDSSLPDVSTEEENGTEIGVISKDLEQPSGESWFSPSSRTTYKFVESLHLLLG